MERPSILFVDDDPMYLEVVTILSSEAFPESDVDTLEDSAMAQSICAAKKYDCVFLDYRMPKLDGLACGKNLRRSFPYLPIVLMTGAGDEMVATSALQNGATDYIPKLRLGVQSMERTVRNAINVTHQRRVIDEQRADLETFAFALAHDFKQPLRQMETFTKMISKGLGDGQPPAIARPLAYLCTAARQLSNLVDVMSQYTLLNKPVTIGDIRVGRVVDEVLTSLSAYIEERNGRVVLERDLVLRGNAVMMGQALQNLIINGLKYNSRADPTVWINMKDAEEYTELLVSDNGIGIERGSLETIFSPLVRLHSQTEYAGVGLGLAMVRKAVAAQNGTIICRSRPGVGSEFLISFRKTPGAGLDPGTFLSDGRCGVEAKSLGRRRSRAAMPSLSSIAV